MNGYPTNYKKCNCYTGENFRKELLESCGGTMLVGYCCCGDVRAVIGTLALVGENFLVLEEPNFIPVPTPPTTAADTTGTNTAVNNNQNGLYLPVPALIIPLERIFAFLEVYPPPVEGGCEGTCATDQTIIKHLAKEHCGQYVEIEICTCLNEGPACVIGTIVEVGCDFIEVRVEDATLCPAGPDLLGTFAGAMANAKNILKGIVNKDAVVTQQTGVIGDLVVRIENVCSVFVNPVR